MLKYYLWILQFMGVANPRSIKLLRHFGSAHNAYNGVMGSNLHFLKDGEKKAYKSATLEKSEEIIKRTEEYGYRIVTFDDESYPGQLKNIYNPPLCIFVRGDIKSLSEKLCIAVIGTREPSEYSYKVVEDICAGLSRSGILVISGMAVGLDKAAHTSALENGGHTAGILACGFDVDYPSKSKAFREEIVKRGGVLITEQLPGARAEGWYFQKRNRILSGLSNGVLIIEADEQSGCMLTANHAIDQDRDLFCIPPANIFDKRYSGVIPYLRDGAIPVFGYKDILNNYYMKEKPAALTGFKSTRRESERPAHDTYSERFDIKANLTENQKIVYNLLKNGARTADFLIENSGLKTDALNEAILELEIDGIIKNAGCTVNLI
ncbi:MAG: DNA-processing protein DprA [Eubacterium sp.]|jgi:DNA processing protein|nr:DNA-processing protein DprA [Eubacterium sp.]